MTVYFDHNASAPLIPAVRSAIAALLQAPAGNASSVHLPGQQARRAIDLAREQVASALGCPPADVVFTSGGSEANLLAWRGAAGGPGPRTRPDGANAVPTVPDHRARAITTTVEHPSVLAAARIWADGGGCVDWLGVDPQGRVDLEQAEALIARRPVTLLSCMAVNNELGVRNPTEKLSELARRAGALHHCDATQALGRVPVDVRAWGVDLLTISGHKIGAPAGVGALYVRQGAPFAPPASGHQERGLRGGTENLLGVVGLGVAAARIGERLAAAQRVRTLRDRLWLGVQALVPDVTRNGAVAAHEETGQTLNLSFAGVPGDRLLMALDLEDIAASAGAACASGSLEPSHVLMAMGNGDAAWQARARQAVRFSLGPESTEQDIARLLAVLPALVARIRGAHGA